MREFNNPDSFERYIVDTWNASKISKIYPFLRGGLFHRTGIDGYRGIRDSGMILTNTGSFPYRYPQSRTYFAHSKGYISLFDFRNVVDQDVIKIHHTWAQFFFDHKPVTIVLKLNSTRLSEKLIPNTAGPKIGSPGHKGYIPYIEAWYPEPITFDTIDSFIIVLDLGSDEPPIFRETPKDKISIFEETINNIEQVWNDHYRKNIDLDKQ